MLTPRTRTYVGLFVVTLTTVTYEILLTRIFSVTMWYHFAFVAISVAMFGMTVGALVVYLRPAWFPDEAVPRRLGLSALAFAFSIVASFLIYVRWPVDFRLSPGGIAAIVLFYAVIALPFVFSGIAVCLTLTRFSARVASLYAVDLCGAAAGCALVIPLLAVTDGPTAVVAVAALAASAAVAFVSIADDRGLARAAVAGAAVLALAAVGHTALVHRQAGVLRMHWVKGTPEPRPLFEKWNSFSRVTVYGDPERETVPRGWGFSRRMPDTRVRQLALLIDAGAGTVLTRFDGRPETIEHLKYDVTNIPHHLRRNARVAIVGAGGGRDVLSALAFGQREVVAIEVNRSIIDVVNERFADFTGHLARDPRVRFVNDEGRSFLTRQREPFDVLQISLIDTWAATAAGAFVLTENALYTVEAWTRFLGQLTPTGVLAVSRYYMQERPDEFYRLTMLARAGLEALGVTAARPHLMIVKQTGPPVRGMTAPVGMATLVVSRSPFPAHDVDLVEEVARRLDFEVVLSPRAAADPVFARLADTADPSPVLAAFPTNIAPPTDDSPFFFQTLRLRNAFRPAATWLEAQDVNRRAVAVLGALLVAVIVLTGACIVLPLALGARAGLRGAGAPLLGFFAGIGVGFMLIEISQMQRLIIVLGHPSYGLSVVLFALLLSSGAGSFAVAWLGPDAGGRPRVGPLLALVAVLVVFGLVTPRLVEGLEGAVTPVRILVAIAMLLPVGFAMGMAFPLGMRLASSRSAAITPWLWGINGATSVCASVLAVVIALGVGISASFWTGVACYAAAAGAFVLARRHA